MVRYILIFIGLISSKCTTHKNEKTIKSIPKIDTINTYKMIEIEGHTFFIDNKLDTVSVANINSEISFYSKGKVIKSIKNSSIEGVYYMKENDIYIKFREYHVQSGYFYSIEKIIKMNKDTIKTEVQKSPQTKGFTITYLRKE